MITVRDIFPEFDQFDMFIAEEKVSSVYVLTNPSTLWERWPGTENDVYIWVVTVDGKNVGVRRSGKFLVHAS